ncbi:MAG: hypothetical protein FJW14_19125 [Acidimicrobiia bacterium]|nr:hypothetical protein [Acidimicrobiia bacterium]
MVKATAVPTARIAALFRATPAMQVRRILTLFAPHTLQFLQHCATQSKTLGTNRDGTDRASDDGRMRRVETVTRRVSYADLQRMPEDRNRYELYDGELYVVPSPLPIHRVVAQRLWLALHDHRQE